MTEKNTADLGLDALTQDEWFEGIQFLTQVGQTCSDRPQELIRLSDILGLSMLTVELNNAKPEGCTAPTVFGPFHLEDAPQYANGHGIGNGAVGQPCRVQGVVRSRTGQPIAGAIVEVRQADDEGLYDVQTLDLDHAQARDVLQTSCSIRWRLHGTKVRSTTS